MATIGSVQSSNRPLTPVVPSQNNKIAGLTDLAAAGQRLSAAYADKAQSILTTGNSDMSAQLAVRARKEGLERADATVRFAKLQGAWSRRAVEIQKEADLGGGNYEDLYKTEFDKQINDFTATLPEHLRNTFLPQIENYKQDQYTGALATQMGMEGKQYIVGLTDLQTEIINSVYTGEKALDEWLPALDTYLENSPLPKAETEELRRNVVKTLQTVDFTQNAKDELANPGMRDSNGVPTGLSAPASALLNTIMGVESFGGEFDVMYSPGGEKRRFTDFSKHPNDPAIIASGPHAGEPSTAAGAGMFIKGTWDYIAGKYNLEDFSPKNQLKGMWFLAQEDYNKRTGRDLVNDLNSNDPIILSSIRRGLSGTWEGLQNMTDVEFVNKLRNGKATLPSVMDDPAYTELSVPEREDLMQKIYADSNAQRTEMLKQQAAQTAATINNLSEQIRAGALKTRADIEAAIGDTPLDFSDREKLYGVQEKYQADSAAIDSFISASSQPGHQFTEKDSKGYTALYERDGRSRVTAMDQDYLNQSILPIVAQSGMVPQTLVTDLFAMAQGNNPQASSFAYQNLAAIQEISKGAAGKLFTADQQSDILFYTQMAPYMSEADRQAEIKVRNSPMMSGVKAQRRQEISQLIATDPVAFSPSTIVTALGGDPSTIDSAAAYGISSAYMQLFETEYSKTGDMAVATENTKKILATRWGVSNVGGKPVFMENPPELLGNLEINGDYSWLDETVRRDMELAPDAEFRLMSDTQTQQERSTGQPPSYIVAIKDPVTGIYLPEITQNGKPKRLNFDNFEEQQKLKLDGSLWKRQAGSLQDMIVTMNGRASFDNQLAGEREASQFLLAIQPEIAKMQPKIGAGKPMELRGINNIEPMSAEQVQAKLKELNYATLEDFAADLPMMDLETLVALLSGEDKRLYTTPSQARGFIPSIAP